MQTGGEVLDDDDADDGWVHVGRLALLRIPILHPTPSSVPFSPIVLSFSRIPSTRPLTTLLEGPESRPDLARSRTFSPVTTACETSLRGLGPWSYRSTLP